MTISAEQLRLLFDSDLPDPQLVVVEGAAQVLPAGEEQGMVVTSRADLLAQHGGRAPSGEALEQLAARLDSAVETMGG